jgi:hypothetical protein
MIELPGWLHETLAIGGVLVAGSWLVLRFIHVGRPREAGCSRCEHASGSAPPTTTGIRSKRLRVLG